MKIKKYKKVSSTNILAKESKLEPWTVILAEEQTAGHGRKGTDWLSPKGGLYFSVVLPKTKIEDLQTLTVLAAFIVARTIKENFGLEALIKLPNDVLIGDKKVAGILTENVIGKDVELSVMGIGINTNIERFPKEFENIATSLKIELGKKVDNMKFLEELIISLKKQLKTISE